MRVWHFNGVITTYGKRDCRNSWRYASLAVNRGAIKRDFTVYICLIISTFFIPERGCVGRGPSALIARGPMMLIKQS